MASIEAQRLRYRRGLLDHGIEPGRAEEITAHYDEGIAAVRALVQRAQEVSDGLGRLKIVDRRRLGDMARSIYALWRRIKREDWPDALISRVVPYAREGLDLSTVIAVTVACYRELDHGGAPMDAKEFEQVAEVRIGEGVTMEEVKMPNDQLPMTNDGTQAAEPRRRRNAPGSDRVAAGTVKPTPLEQFSEKRAVEQLRLALARFEPVVKKCVAFRLLKHESYKKLAKELDLSLEEVKEILAAVRPKVRAFTTYFDTDWHWVEGAKRTFVS
jgi:hypothetical protein